MINRRNLISSMVSVAITTAASPALSLSQSGSSPSSSSQPSPSEPDNHNTAPSSKPQKIPWRNWSGYQQCFPQVRKAPATLAELQQIITSAPGCIRPVGAGHSFMPLVPTDDTMVSLSRMSGVITHNRSKLQTRVMAGTRLGDIGAPLEKLGQAMINMPDIDEQSLAGALSTATHGTGATLGCLSTFVQALQLVTADGEVIECSATRNPDIFKAALVSLGALGITTEVTLQNAPVHRLKRETDFLGIEDILQNAETLADNNRNFEFYYVPYSGMGFIDLHNITDEPVSATEKLDQNEGAETLKSIRDWLSWSPKLRQLLMQSYFNTLSKEVTVANAWENYSSERNVRFNEMEYHLPRENGLNAFREIKMTLEKNFPEVFFPIEVRYIKADDIWLSPFNRQDSMSIAVHRYFNEDFKPYFAAIEPIFQKYGGRAHWGKLNTLNAKQLEALYPNWNDFKAIRQQLDPEGKFLNNYLKSIFDIT